jgi:hypothetical protein
VGQFYELHQTLGRVAHPFTQIIFIINVTQLEKELEISQICFLSDTLLHTQTNSVVDASLFCKGGP